MGNKAPQRYPSQITRPYVISVDADIPDGSAVKVTCEGTMGNPPYHQTFITPQQTPFDQARCNNIQVDLIPDPNTLSAPFLYAIITEGDRTKTVFEAELFAGTNDPAGPVLMKPTQGRHFLTLGSPFFRHAAISACATDSPFMFEVVGVTPPGTSIVCNLTFHHADGTTQTQKLDGPCKVPLAEQGLFSKTIQLAASPDGGHTPSLYGLAVEGGGRRHFLSATKFAQEFGDGILDKFWIITIDDDDGICTLKPIPPKFDGPPTIVDRLHKLFDEGKLKAEAGVNDAITG